jgi:hypothetical protein
LEALHGCPVLHKEQKASMVYVYHIQIKRRKWNWIGHTLNKEAGTTEKTCIRLELSEV